MTGKEDAGLDLETMAVVLYCVVESGVTLGDKHYQMMSALDGKRSASAYQHQFRKVEAHAKGLQQQAASSSSVGTPVKGKAKGGSKTATPATSAKKRGKIFCPLHHFWQIPTSIAV